MALFELSCIYRNFSGATAKKAFNFKRFRRIQSIPKQPSKIAKQPLTHKTRNQVYRKVPWVRIPPPPPKRSKSRSHYDCGIFLVFPVISMLSGVFNSIKQYRCEHHPNAFISVLFSKMLMKMLTKTWEAELTRSPFYI